MPQPRSASPVITLTTDFGLSDGYVGAMHGVILGLCPEARIVDISHDIAPQDVRQAAFVLESAYRYFPAGAIHVAVVDPGVGSARRLVAVQTAAAFFVAPDNGLLTPILEAEPILAQVQLTRPAYWLPQVSHTFHGRDILAPVAAHLARGVALADLGEAVTDLARLPLPRPSLQPDGAIAGQVLHTDRFGNLITNVPGELLAGPVAVEIAGRRIRGLSPSYAAAEPGQLVALISSRGRLEIAVREGSAARELGAGPGEPVRIRPL